MKGLDLIFSLDPTLPSLIFIDGKRLCQILLNLLINAVKFTFTGSVKLEITLLETLEDSNFKIGFNVVDTGIGIKQDDLINLFKLFGKLQSSNHLNRNGVGLGLSFSKSLVEKLGGAISVSSEVGKGTAFSFEIKVAGFLDSKYQSPSLDICKKSNSSKSNHQYELESSSKASQGYIETLED